MGVRELGRDEFEAMVDEAGLHLVCCWASGCGACGELLPVFERVAGRHPEHRFARLNTQAEGVLAAALEVTHVPTLLVYRDGLLLLRHPGGPDEAGLESIVSQAQSLDMDQVRREVEREQRGGADVDQAEPVTQPSRTGQRGMS